MTSQRQSSFRPGRAFIAATSICLALGLALTGCTSGDDVTPDGDVDAAPTVQPTPQEGALPEGFVALSEESGTEEYTNAIAEIGVPLPPGVDYPDGLPADFFPTDGVLQEGAGRNQAWFTWLCAWEGEYLDAFDQDDVQRQATAEEMISSWAEMPFYVNVMVDPSKGWVSNVVTPMQLGDPTGVKFEYSSMCPKFPTVAAS